jgi:hypothetical protein
MLRMIRQDAAPLPSPVEAPSATFQTPKPGRPGQGAKKGLPLFNSCNLSERAIARIRSDFPGWDIRALQAEFDTWLGEQDGRAPKDYEAAFYGFVRRVHTRDGA